MTFSKKPKQNKTRKVVLWTLWLIICLGSLAGGAMLNYINNSTPVVAVAIKMLPEIWTNPNPASHFGKDKINLLILGADYNYTKTRQIIKENARSDAIFLLHCDFSNGNEKVNVMSIPRDTIVHIPDHGRRKINSAMALGGEDLTRRTIEELLNITIHEVIVLDFQGFQKFINAIGGVWINVEKKMDYDDNWGNLHIHLKPGYQWLDGYQAMGFVRFRHSDSDLHRIKRQQQFVQAVKDRLRQQSISKMPNIMQKIRDCIGGTITDDQTLISWGAWMRKIDMNNITMETLPTRNGSRGSLEIIQKAAEDLVIQLNFRSSFSATFNDANNRKSN